MSGLLRKAGSHSDRRARVVIAVAQPTRNVELERCDAGQGFVVVENKEDPELAVSPKIMFGSEVRPLLGEKETVAGHGTLLLLPFLDQTFEPLEGNHV